MPQPLSFTDSMTKRPRLVPWVQVAVWRIELSVAGLYGDLAVFGNGVPRVDQQVGQDLVDLGRVGIDRPQPGPGLPCDIDILSDKAQQHLEGFFGGLVQVERSWGDGLLAGQTPIAAL